MHEKPEYITLTEATKLTPSRPSTNCVWRWCRKGVRSRGGDRIRLRHVRIGGKIYTTAKWLEEFGEGVARADAEHFDLESDMAESIPRPPRRRSKNRRQAEIERAERELTEAGV